MGNPFTDELEEYFRGHYVEVTTPKATFTGYVRVFHYNDNEVILHGASKNGQDVGSVVISDYTDIQNHNQPDLTEVPVDEIQDAPYSVRQYEGEGFDTYVRKLRRRDALFSFPTVRPHPETDGYEILSGHKRTNAARQAGFDTIPTRIASKTDWEALLRFVDEHIPISKSEYQSSGKHTNWYSIDEAEQSIDVMLNRWSEDELREIPALEYWLDEVLAEDEWVKEDEGEDDAEPREEDSTSTPSEPKETAPESTETSGNWRTKLNPLHWL